MKVRSNDCSLPDTDISSYGLDCTTDSYEQHYGPTSAVLTDAKRDTVEKHSWKISKGKYGRIGPVVEYLPDIEPLPSTPQSSVSANEHSKYAVI